MMIRQIEQADRADYLQLTEEFYKSPAVLHDIPVSYREAAFEELMKQDGSAFGKLFFVGKRLAGYVLFAKSFAQEVGGSVLWVEELYIRPEFRGEGLGSEFFAKLFESLPKDVKRVRLEVEPENEKAVALYQRLGFKELPYMQMVRDYTE